MPIKPSLRPADLPETVYVMDDPKSGLKGVIVLHSTRLGPAAGGTRLWSYPDSAAAARDAMRLAEGMAFKNALADLPLGGGKAVIELPRGAFDRRRLFDAFGREVAKLGGDYVTAEDVGTSVADMEIVRGRTRHVAGLEKRPGRPGGDPSPWTALAVFVSMRHAVKRRLGADLCDVTVAVQGLGHVGGVLCELLHDAGAKLVVAETRSGVAMKTARRLGALVMEPDEIAAARCDVFAPCALGAVLNADSVSRLQAKVVCGAANNVLASPEDGDALARRGVLYCPDYVVNSGGIINVCAEYLGWTTDDVERRVNATGERLAAVLDFAEAEGVASNRAADELARAKIAEAGCNVVAA